MPRKQNAQLKNRAWNQSSESLIPARFLIISYLDGKITYLSTTPFIFALIHCLKRLLSNTAYRVSGSGDKATVFADVAVAREFRVILPLKSHQSDKIPGRLRFCDPGMMISCVLNGLISMNLMATVRESRVVFSAKVHPNGYFPG